MMPDHWSFYEIPQKNENYTANGKFCSLPRNPEISYFMQTTDPNSTVTNDQKDNV